MKQEFKVRLPERVPMEYVWPVLVFLFAIQMLEGTKLLTSLAYCAFTLVMVDAFNVSGGLVYPSGAYIFFCGLLTLIVGGLGKTVLGEPLDTNIFDAQKSILVYLAGACSIWAAARINAATRRKRPFLWKTQLTSNIDQAALGAALLGQFGWIFIPMAYMSTFTQMNAFLPLALMLSVYSTTKKTDGRRSFSMMSLAIWAWVTSIGLFSFSKQGLFAPSLAWAIGAAIAGYRMTFRRALFIIVFGGSMAAFLTPVSQVGRVYRYLPDSQERAIDLLMHPMRTREVYLEQQAFLEDAPGYHWFNHSQGLLDRLTMLPIDDALIHRTDRGYSPGLFPIQTYMANMIPRYLVGNKIVYHWGNTYAHEIGMLASRDLTTGISFSPFSDVYHEMQWWGVTLIIFPIFLVMFWVCDSLTGSTNDTIWASIYLLIFAHSAPEGAMNTPFAAISVYVAIVTVAAVMSRYVLPVVGSLLMPVRRVIGMSPVTTAWQPQRSPLFQAAPRTIEEKL